ncbi:chemotaxis protein CheW [Nocardioides sp. 616]|uniref:chemotaxis protein CheW n=1 Tax=Nocardioides sp. 616 TaxID=2268090 RepID=UPI001965F9E3|nr:chemotaxis protein CheW [Nocardioides sp. 616]
MSEVVRMPLVAQYCTFTLDGLFFGVHVHEVQEVLRHQPMTPVPLAPDAVRGLINLRGQIVTAIDLRLRLGRSPGPASALPLNVVVRSQGEAVSLLVDEIGDVVDAGGLDLLPAPANLPVAIRELLQGVVALPDSILLVLDADRAVELTDPPLGGTP